MNKSFNELPGCFAYSLAGHDKGETYIIIECNDEYAFLANGKNRTINNPKKKKLKHLQINKHKNELILVQMYGLDGDIKGHLNDEVIRMALCKYSKDKEDA